MGCARSRYYWDDAVLYFPEMDDDIGCLCTFPHNYQRGLDPDVVFSLAMLGTAVHLLPNNAEGWHNVREVVPRDIENELRRILGVPVQTPAKPVFPPNIDLRTGLPLPARGPQPPEQR